MTPTFRDLPKMVPTEGLCRCGHVHGWHREPNVKGWNVGPCRLDLCACKRYDYAGVPLGRMTAKARPIEGDPDPDPPDTDASIPELALAARFVFRALLDRFPSWARVPGHVDETVEWLGSLGDLHDPERPLCWRCGRSTDPGQAGDVVVCRACGAPGVVTPGRAHLRKLTPYELAQRPEEPEQ